MDATETETEMWEVGGCLRDALLGVTSKDVDFTVVGPKSFLGMVDFLTASGFIVHTTNEDTLTAVCKVPASKPELLARTKNADFVWARRESNERVGRTPVWVKPGTLLDDLARRDFTMNAWAKHPKTGEIVDPHNGQADTLSRTLRFVGDPFARIEQDALRIIRAFRFIVTRGFVAAPDTWDALCSDRAVELLGETFDGGKRILPVDRFRTELTKMFKGHTLETLALFRSLPEATVEAMFPDGLWLLPTVKG